MVNSNIGCNVNECKYHAENQPLCTLNHIEVVKHKTPVTCAECTDCASFEQRC